MSDLVERLRCFNPMTGKPDGEYCVWEGAGKCVKCEAADELERLEAALRKIERVCTFIPATFNGPLVYAREALKEAEQ